MMFLSSARRPASKGRFFVRPEVAVGALLIFIILALVYQINRFKGRVHTAQQVKSLVPLTEDIFASKAALVKQIEAWNLKAVQSGQSAQQIQMSVAAPLPKKFASASNQGSSGCACEKEPADPRFTMRPVSEVEKENPALAAALKKSAKNNEVMLALANGIMICKNSTICWWNGGNILESFLQIIDRNKITNHLIGIMDDETEAYLKGRPYNYFRVNIAIPESQKDSHPANKVSTIKYTLLKQIIQMGYHTLITDMDLVYLKNPFDHLHRDADIEIQTDGFDETSYGVIDSVHDPTMGWGAGGLFMRLFTTNVGCMWVKASIRSFTLMSQVSEHLTKKAGWDQQVFNEYLLRPSHANFQNAGCSLRVLDYMKFVNSKIFFKSRRAQFIPGSTTTAEAPIMVHFNYHPDKHVRMLCIMDRYFNGNVSACDHFPPGSDPK